MTRHLEEAHRVQRPEWNCVLDGLPWPCHAARAASTKVHGADRDGLAVQMSVLMAQAAIDLHVLDPTRLYRRFVAWALPTGRTCRVCGGTTHDAIAGVPPSLIPCLVAERLGHASTSAKSATPDGDTR